MMAKSMIRSVGVRSYWLTKGPSQGGLMSGYTWESGVAFATSRIMRDFYKGLSDSQRRVFRSVARESAQNCRRGWK